LTAESHCQLPDDLQEEPVSYIAHALIRDQAEEIVAEIAVTWRLAKVKAQTEA
ncbi:MAG: hypothetical protein GXP10_05225, partial [Gammaproteobacteria bacterium]|nr:hypothetical protein [Gammaproteobacteria bacterium]